MASWSLPWPPSVNHMYARTASGQVRLTDEARAYRAEVIVMVRQSGAVLPAGPLALTLWLTPPDKRVRDWDGPIKATQDALFAGFGEDDGRVCEGHVYRLAPKAPGSVLAMIRTVAQYQVAEQMGEASPSREEASSAR